MKERYLRNQLSISRVYLGLLLSFLVCIFLFVLPNIGTKAQLHEIKLTKDYFKDADDNSIKIITNLDSNENRIFFIDYSGANRAIGCECDNRLMIYAERITLISGVEKKEEIYKSEWFDWNELKHIYIYLPKVGQGTTYSITMFRGSDIDHNKGCYDTKLTYYPNGTHKDQVSLKVSFSTIQEIGFKEKSLKVGDTTNALFKCDDFIGLTSWDTRNNSILTVREDGFITALKPGNATVLLNIEGDEVFRQDVSVESVKGPSDISLFEKETKEISVEGVNGDIQWKSSDDSIAAITGNTVIAVNPGIATITGSLNNLTVSFRVTVKSPTLSSSEVSLYSGEEFCLSVTGPDKKITWKSDNTKVAVVDNGRVKAKSPGKAKITALVGERSLECNVQVKRNELNESDLEIESGDHFQLYHLSSASGEWTSENDEVVKCVGGYITALNGGTTYVKLKIESEVIDCRVKVLKKQAPSEFSYKKSSNVIQLSWNMVDYANQYAVYIYDEKKNSFVLDGYTKEPSYEKLGLTPNTTYTFRIAAYLMVDGNNTEQKLSEKIKIKTDKKEKTGWVTVEGKKYYYQNGFPVKNQIVEVGGQLYFLDSDGCLVYDSFVEYENFLYKAGSEGKIIRAADVTDKKKGLTYEAGEDGKLYLRLHLNTKLYSGMNINISSESGFSISNLSKAKLVSENKKVAYVENGHLYTVKPGTTVIKGIVGKVSVYNEKGQWNFSNMPVVFTADVRASKLYSDEVEVRLGDNVNINVKGSTATPKYESCNNKIVSVKKGHLTAVGTGKATVKVTVGKEVLKCKVTVNKLSAPTGISAEADVSKIKLTWNSYAGAKNYSVYSYNKKTKKCSLLGKTKKTNYVVKKLKSDTEYCFKIAANVKVNGVVSEQELSDVIECRTIENINGWVTKNGKKYYYKKGHPLGTGLQKIKGKLYLFDDDYSLITNGFNSYKNVLYYSDSDGVIAQNKEVKDSKSGTVYIADKSGALTVKPTGKDELKKINAILYTGDSSYTSLCAVVIQNNGSMKIKIGGSSSENFALVYPYENADPSAAYLFSEESYSEINSKTIGAGKTGACYFVMDESRYISPYSACISFIFYYDGIKYFGIVDVNGNFVYEVYK